MTTTPIEPTDAGIVLADLLCLPVDGQPVESRRGYLSDRVVTGAAALVDATGLVEQWEEWFRDDHPDWQTRGGRPGSIGIRPVLTMLVALVASGEPPLASASAKPCTNVCTPRCVTCWACHGHRNQ